MASTALKPLKDKYDEYPDDIFKDTRMPLGDHIEELRYRMITALKWLIFFLVIGFVLDGVGSYTGNDNIGIGRPMLKVITEPVESQTRDFYYRRTRELQEKKLKEMIRTAPDDVAVVWEKLKQNGYSLSELSSEEKEKLRNATQPLRALVDTKQFEPIVGTLKPGAPAEFSLTLQVYPAELNVLSDQGQALMESNQYVKTLSAQEAFMVYFKVSLLCGVVIGSPFILYQFWAFVGAGLYPHEKRYVYLFFGPSVGLFIAGTLLCQFFVLPGAVKALLKFNELLGFDPDIRLNEWLGLAIVLPLVFGVSFQTPLVMIFLNRIGMFTAHDYLTKWRYACFIIAIFAAIITPTPDAITMMYLFIPMFGLFLVGIAFCHWFPGFDPNEDEETETAEEVAV